MSSPVSKRETQLRTLLKMAEVLRENIGNSDFNQADIMCERYKNLLGKLVSIYPEAASLLPSLKLKSTGGVVLVNLETRLREAKMASEMMIAYLEEKLSSIGVVKYSKNNVSIGAVANFFGLRRGVYSDTRMFASLGMTNVPGRNKAERIAHVLRETYVRDRYTFERVVSALIQYHRLSEKDFEELNQILPKIGYVIRDGKMRPTLPKEIVEARAKPFDAYLQIEKVLQLATKEVKIIDAYVDESLFLLYFHKVPLEVTIKILTMHARARKEMFDRFVIVAKKFKKQKDNFEVRKSTEIHDRYLIIDHRAWMIGQSIKDAGGRAPLSIIEVENVDAVLKMFDALWNKADKVV